MTNTQHFPSELLTAPIADRIAYFENCTIKHAMLEDVSKQTEQALYGHASPKVIMLAGPTGVGKTTLASTLYRRISKQFEEQMNNERDFMPILQVNAIAPTAASFSWKDFYVRILERAREPLIDRKVTAPHQLSLFPDERQNVVSDRAVADTLRRAVELCLLRRRTRYLIIDEAHHILMVNNPKRLEFQFEALKSLAIETKATIVLVGTYRLLDIRDQSGQLVRRSEIIHFPRYDHRKQKEKVGFVQALNTLAGRLPLSEFPDLQANADEFYIRSVGCVGILKDWLSRAYARHLELNNKLFNWDFIQGFAQPVKALETITAEALLGEEKVRDKPIADLMNLLHFGVPPEGEKKPKKRGTVVGKRLPVRDPVGEAYASA
ncbi:TniB family NTP-binding protein [Pseudoduganella aquatica]|uniref:TniB family NTP-binding protein n=1 Tax=Pseudoduganella aquatica TaxID=2660641 RepID=UPI001E5F493C|nr:TniB family NTP-binding protein [Pseudoduganella aquatica]